MRALRDCCSCADRCIMFVSHMLLQLRGICKRILVGYGGNYRKLFHNATWRACCASVPANLRSRQPDYESTLLLAIHGTTLRSCCIYVSIDIKLATTTGKHFGLRTWCRCIHFANHRFRINAERATSWDCFCILQRLHCRGSRC